MHAPRDLDPPGAAAVTRRDWIRRLAVVAGVGALLALAYGSGLHRELSFEALVRERASIETFVSDHRLTAVLIFIALYVSVTTFAVPAGGALLVLIGGFLFGAAIGGPAATIGSTLGATIIYLVARSAFGNDLARAAGPFAERFAGGFRADAFSYIFFMRMIPVPSWLVSSGSAVLGVPVWIFVAATALGRVPGSLVFALFGSGLDDVIDGQEAAYKNCLAAGGADCRIEFDPSSVLTSTLIVAFVALGLLALLPVLAKRFWWRRTGVASQPDHS
jgi:uncharacterized membrane protein YdjX (TVP38/TMEM64 family)